MNWANVPGKKWVAKFFKTSDNLIKNHAYQVSITLQHI